MSEVASHIERVGVGPYQWKQTLLVACFFLAEASELDVISPLTTAWRLQWALLTDDVAALASAGFVGFAAGTLLSGLLGDRFGRRAPILAGYVGAILGAVGMWGAATPLVVGAFRTLAGFSVGLGVPAALTMVSEIAPAKNRGQLLSACYVALALGALYADLGLFFFLPNLRSGDWRSLCLWSALPAAVALPFGLLALEDTPSYHALQGDFASLDRVLTKMSEENQRPDAVWRPLSAPAGGSVQDLRAALPEAGDQASADESKAVSDIDLLWKSAVPLVGCAALDFSYNFVGFGTAYFLPIVLAELTDSAPVPPIAELVISNLVTFPALFLAYAVLSSEVGNKQVLLVSGCVQIGAFLCFYAGTPGSLLQLAGVIALKLSAPAFSQTTNIVKGEMFRLRVRVTALSISGTCGRMGALLAPGLIEKSRGEPGSADEFSVFLTCLVVVVAVAVTTGMTTLPETKGSRLPD